MIAMRQGDEARAIRNPVALYEFGIARNLPRVLPSAWPSRSGCMPVRGGPKPRLTCSGNLTPLGWSFNNRLISCRLVCAESACHNSRICQPGEVGLDQRRRDLGACSKRSRSCRGRMCSLPRRAGPLLRTNWSYKAREEHLRKCRLAELGESQLRQAEHPRLASLIVSDQDSARVAPGSSRPDTVARPGVMCGLAARRRLRSADARRGTDRTLLATGKANKEIARAMDIVRQTVKGTSRRVLQLNAASRKQRRGPCPPAWLIAA